MDDQRKDHPDPKRLPPQKKKKKNQKKKSAEQLRTHYVPIDNEENINGSNLGGDLLFCL